MPEHTIPLVRRIDDPYDLIVGTEDVQFGRSTWLSFPADLVSIIGVAIRACRVKTWRETV